MFGRGCSRVLRRLVTSRFSSNVMTLLAGVFLLAASLGFRSSIIGWLDFAAGCLVSITVLWAFAIRGRGRAQRVLDVATVLVGGWAIVGGRSFPAATVKWLTFADGILLITISVIGLVAHEVVMEMALEERDPRANGRMASPQERIPTSGAR
jgi:hypothetical protein